MKTDKIISIIILSLVSIFFMFFDVKMFLMLIECKGFERLGFFLVFLLPVTISLATIIAIIKIIKGEQNNE
jgi:hypothetical protein